jgi:hypothetical protein
LRGIDPIRFAAGLDDVLMRRTRLVFESRDRAIQAANRTAELMAAELGWDAARTTREVAEYTARATAELAAEQTGNDIEAEAAWHRVAAATGVAERAAAKARLRRALEPPRVRLRRPLHNAASLVQTIHRTKYLLIKKRREDNGAEKIERCASLEAMRRGAGER